MGEFAHDPCQPRPDSEPGDHQRRRGVERREKEPGEEEERGDPRPREEDEGDDEFTCGVERCADQPRQREGDPSIRRIGIEQDESDGEYGTRERERLQSLGGEEVRESEPLPLPFDQEARCDQPREAGDPQRKQYPFERGFQRKVEAVDAKGKRCKGGDGEQARNVHPRAARPERSHDEEHPRPEPMRALQVKVHGVGDDHRVDGEEEREDDGEGKTRLGQAFLEDHRAGSKRQCGDQQDGKTRGFHQGSQDRRGDDDKECAEI